MEYTDINYVVNRRGKGKGYCFLRLTKQMQDKLLAVKDT